MSPRLRHATTRVPLVGETHRLPSLGVSTLMGHLSADQELLSLREKNNNTLKVSQGCWIRCVCGGAVEGGGREGGASPPA